MELTTGTLPPLPVPPVSVTTEDGVRCEHTRMRRALLTGRGQPYVQARMRRNLGDVRTDAIGDADLSANPFDATCGEAAALFEVIPRIHQADAASQLAMTEWTTRAQLYPLMASVQKQVLGMREVLVRVEASFNAAGSPQVAYVPVTLDMVVPRADPKNPSKPIEIREFVERPDPSNPSRTIWTQDVWSIDGKPAHHVLDAYGVAELSHHYGLPRGGLVGDAYPYIRRDGRAVLPYALYHAAITGQLLDPYYRRELIDGVLNVGVLWTFFTHCLRRASWPQRWITGGFLAGEHRAADGVQRVIADPSTILQILQDPHFEGQVSAGQWGSASDPKAVAEAISIYEQRFTGYVELGAEFWRRSSDPRSGLALSLDRTGRLEAQRKYGPIFAPVDAEVLEITAVGINRLLRAPLVAEDGWRVEHLALPPSIEQRKADREGVHSDLDKGLITKAEARALLRGEDLAVAETKLPSSPETPMVGIVEAVRGIVEAVALGKMPRDAGAAQIARAYVIEIGEAEQLLGSAGNGFVPSTSTP